MNKLISPRFAVLDRILGYAHGAIASRPAIEDTKGVVDYRTFVQQIADIRGRLPLPKGEPCVVAIHGSVDRDFLPLILAVWTLGHVVLPVDRYLPPDRKRAMLERDWLGLIIDLAPEPLMLEVAAPVWRAHETVQLPEPPDLSSLRSLKEREGAAYVTFSSGTTGVPKAILGRAESLSHFIEWQAKEFDFTAEDRVPVLTSPSFDPYMREVLTVLSVGGTLILPRERLQLERNALMQFLHDKQITRLHVVPTLARHWSRAPEKQDLQLPSLKTIFFAGEPLSSELVERWRRCAPLATMVNLYGPSETTLARFYHRLPADLHPSNNLPVGKPLPDSRAVVLGQNRAPVANGETGEVFIDTRYSSFGTVEYGWQDSGLASPFAQYGKYLYPTGDVGRITNGLLEILGRTDGQLKIAGIRFHPQEITAALSAVDGVAEACAFIVEVEAKKAVHAIYVAEDSAQPLSDERIRRALAKRLQAPLIPSRIVAVKTFPFTPNGKIDKAEMTRITMRQPVGAISSEGTVFEEGLTEATYVDETLSVFSKVFNYPEIKVGNNFYELGGDSVTATEIAAQLSQRTGKRLASADVLAHPILGELAKALPRFAPIAETPDKPAGQPSVNQPARIELSQRQLAYRAVCMAEGDRDWCTLSRVLDDVGDLEPNVLRKTLRVFAEHHDVLRLQFAQGGADGMQQLIRVDESFAEAMPIESHDFSMMHAEQCRHRLAKLRAEGSRRMFDLSKAPLVRFATVKVQNNSHLLIWVHHLIMDGPSLNMFANELLVALAGRVQEISFPSAGYRDFVSWQTKGSASRESEAARNYWLKLLADYRPVRVNERRLDDRLPEGYSFTRPLAGGLVEAVRKRAVEWQCTPFTVLLGGFIRAIGKRAKHDSPAIILPTQARGEPCFADTMGLFFSMAIVRLEVGAIAKDGMFTKQLQRQLSNAARYCEYEFHKRVEDVAAADDPYFFPLTTALFNQNILPKDMSYNAATPMGLHALGRSLRFQIQGEVQIKGNDFLISYLHRETSFADEGGIEPFADAVEAEIMEIVL